jgi:hypothetical protein
MEATTNMRKGWKARIVHELGEYGINVVYLAVVFGAFGWYRRLILAQHGISYLNYGIALIEALILAKVIMIGDFLHIGRRFVSSPLIVPTLFRTFIFTIWVGLFKVIEHLVKGLLDGKGFGGALEALLQRSPHEVLAGCLMIFFAFIPFFAIRALGETMGKGRIGTLFFQRREERHR